MNLVKSKVIFLLIFSMFINGAIWGQIVTIEQTFVYSNNPLPKTVADLPINGLPLGDIPVWMDAETGGNIYLLTDTLISGQQYFLQNTENYDIGSRLRTTVFEITPSLVADKPNNVCTGDVVTINANGILTVDEFIANNTNGNGLDLELITDYQDSYYFIKKQISSWTAADNLISSIPGASMYIADTAVEDTAVLDGLIAKGYLNLPGSPSLPPNHFAIWLGLVQYSNAVNFNDDYAPGNTPTDGGFVNTGWYWVDGSPVSYENWDRNGAGRQIEPNDYRALPGSTPPFSLGNPPNDEDYAQFNFQNRPNGVWVDSPDASAGHNSVPLFEFEATTGLQWSIYNTATTSYDILPGETNGVLNVTASVGTQRYKLDYDIGGVLQNPLFYDVIGVDPITPTFTAVAPICSGNTLSPLPTTSNNSITGTWSPALDNTTTTTYTFTPNTGQCATAETLSITVNPSITPTFTAIAPICSGNTLSPLPTTSNNSITGTWSPALDNTTTTTYTFTPDSGQCASTETLTIAVNPSTTPTFTTVAPICSGDTLSPLPTTSNNSITGTWSPALDNTATTTYTFTPDAGQCASTETLTITVNPNVTPTFTQVADICSGDTLSPLPTTSTESITGTWAPALDNTATTTYTFTPDSGQCASTQTMTITVNPQTTPTFTQVAGICNGDTLSPLPTTSAESITGTWSPTLDNTSTTTYAFTPDSGQCATTQTMTITVNPTIIPTFTQVADICSGDTLSPLPTTSAESITGTWSPGIDNTVTTTYTFTPDSGQCASTQTMTITVNPIVTPTFTQVADICSGDTLSPLPTTSAESVTGTWSPALDNTSTTTYTFTPNSGQCSTTQNMTITVSPTITPTFTQVADICSGDTLSPLPTTSAESITGTWSPTLDNTATTTYTFTPNSGQCASTKTMTITVNPGSLPTLTEPVTLCPGDTPMLDAITTIPNPIYQWASGEATQSIQINSAGAYSVEVSSSSACSFQTINFTVTEAVIPVIESVKPDGNNIIVNTSNTGDFEYSIDGTNFQSSNTFFNVQGGTYTISVKQIDCPNPVTTQFVHFFIPRFFTPNGDTVNDTFNLKGIESYSYSQVSIFDRYGKLLKNSVNAPFSWNGTFNNQLLPTGDYWYVIVIDNQKLTGHFTLKR